MLRWLDEVKKQLDNKGYYRFVKVLAPFKNLRITMYMTLLRPIDQYCSETWVLNKLKN